MRRVFRKVIFRPLCSCFRVFLSPLCYATPEGIVAQRSNCGGLIVHGTAPVLFSLSPIRKTWVLISTHIVKKYPFLVSE